MTTDLLEERQLPRSIIRHRPIAPDATHTQVRTPRARQYRQKHEPHTTGGPPSVAPTRSAKASGTSLIYLLLGMLCACFLIWIAGLLVNWGSTTLDDLHYGRPRTTQVDHFVGHETGHTPTHFIALNLSGQIYIIEIPGGTNTSQLLIGPHLIGPGSDLSPVSLSFPGDQHHPDLLITIQNIQMRFHNTGSAYVPASP